MTEQGGDFQAFHAMELLETYECKARKARVKLAMWFCLQMSQVSAPEKLKQGSWFWHLCRASLGP